MIFPIPVAFPFLGAPGHFLDFGPLFTSSFEPQEGPGDPTPVSWESSPFYLRFPGRLLHTGPGIGGLGQNQALLLICCEILGWREQIFKPQFPGF